MLIEKSSFRDPSGQVFEHDGQILRYVYPSYFADYKKLMESRLYSRLTTLKLLIKHTELFQEKDKYIIRPDIVPFISYPYEWCFSMLKEAALNTLKINRIALEHGMILKDASAYNMQYYQGNMRLIDTLSFMSYEPGQLWGAYRQFLQHFLYPLLLMAHYNPYINKLSQIHIDGIPAGFVINNLPFYCRFKPSLWAHVYAHGLSYNGNGHKQVTMSRYALEGLLDNLEVVVRGLKYQILNSDFIKYSELGSYTPDANLKKIEIIAGILPYIHKGTLCDLGANTGKYSNMAVLAKHSVISVDSNHDCIENLYQQKMALPLIVDLCNPSPAIGFDNTERKSFLDRLHVDTIMALALIHHLCVGNNVPLGRVAEMLSQHCKNLIIEFVPLDDPKAQQLLGKKNIPPYSLDIFKAEFSKWFNIRGEYPITDSLRTIYLMEAIPQKDKIQQLFQNMGINRKPLYAKDFWKALEGK